MMLRHYDWQYSKRGQCFLESEALEAFAAEISSHAKGMVYSQLSLQGPRDLRNILGLCYIKRSYI
jgi:hypothetical protein